MDPIKRLTDIVDQANKSRELPATMTMEKYLQILNELHQMGTFYTNNGQDEEKAFILFLRFISIVVEELPRHPNIFLLPLPIKLLLDAKALSAMSKAEELKQKILKRFEMERKRGRRNGEMIPTNEIMIPSTSNNSSCVIPRQQQHLSDHKLSPYVRCQDVSMQPIMFQRLIIPSNISAFADPYTDDERFHFAILYGRYNQASKSVVVCRLLPCTPESIPLRSFRRFVSDPESGEDLPIVGCICSSLEKCCRLGFFRACQISEMICIISSPDSKTMVLHLVNMSPNGGSAFHVNKTGECPQSSSATCSHLKLIDSAATANKKQQHEKDGELGCTEQQNGRKRTEQMEEDGGGGDVKCEEAEQEQQQQQNSTARAVSSPVQC